MTDQQGTERRVKIQAGEGRTWPERRVIAVGLSPMNPRVKWALLDCDHTVFRQRKPRIGALVVCDKCSAKAAGWLITK